MKFFRLLAALLCLGAGGLGFAQEPLLLDAAIKTAARELAGGIPVRTPVLVLHFTSPSRKLSAYLVTELTYALSERPSVKVIEGRNRPSLLHFNLQPYTELNDTQAASIGAEVRVMAVIVGSLTREEDVFTLRARSVSVQTGRMTGRERVYPLAQDGVLAGLLASEDFLPPPVPAPEADPAPEEEPSPSREAADDALPPAAGE
ncbi:MAG: hypothetical protein LBR16_02375 [Treponema sp.]|jgi:hypothetical protein|nr:hypothetical protein [Treponema sp.]